MKNNQRIYQIKEIKSGVTGVNLVIIVLMKWIKRNNDVIKISLIL